MCPDCKRQKMLFDTREQAINFIKFNGDDIDTHGGVLRPYYCPACCGYHITSKEYNEKYEGRTDKLIKAYKRSKPKKNKIVMDALEKKQKRHEIETLFVNKVYSKYIANNSYEDVADFMTEFYPNLPKDQLSIVSDRVRHRQEAESEDRWKSLLKEEKTQLLDMLAIKAVKRNLDEMCVLETWIKKEYKLIPKGCIPAIRDRCIVIRDEMG